MYRAISSVRAWPSAPAERAASISFALSLLEGCLLVALGLVILRSSGLLTSGVAGLAMVLERALPLSFGTLFTIANLPFYLLAVCGMGWRFTVKTAAAVALLGLLTDLLAAHLLLEFDHPVVGALLGGALVGYGLVILIRSGASLGGVNILAVYLERRFAIHPGRTTFAVDLLIALSALCLFSTVQVVLSLLGLGVLSLVLGRYKRRSDDIPAACAGA